MNDMPLYASFTVLYIQNTVEGDAKLHNVHAVNELMCYVTARETEQNAVILLRRNLHNRWTTLCLLRGLAEIRHYEWEKLSRMITAVLREAMHATMNASYV